MTTKTSEPSVTLKTRPAGHVTRKVPAALATPAPAQVLEPAARGPLQTPLGRVPSSETTPSSKWNNLSLSDFGNFEIVNLPKARGKKKRLTDDEPACPFITGESPLIYYVVTPVITKTKRKIKSPINLNNKVSRKQRDKFSRRLEHAINDMANLFTDEILPQTLALETALDRVNEATQQMADVNSGIPPLLIKRKFESAINVRVLRYVSEKLGLTKTEHRLLLNQMLGVKGEQSN